MTKDLRESKRFPDFARAKLDIEYSLSGYLEDVCEKGCKVRFPFSLDLDIESEYNLSILPTNRSRIREFSITVQPKWIKSDDNSTEVGFFVLPCPDIKLFESYIDIHKSIEEDEF